MNHKFTTLICFLLVLSGLQAASISRPSPNRSSALAKSRLLEAVTQNGQITLQKDSVGFYVSADFVYNPTDASDSDANDPDMASMSLALYTSETVLTESCLQFDSYVCSSYTCTPYTYWDATRYFPYFKVTGYHASADVYLDYSNWHLADYATVATSCEGSTYYPYGNGRYGIIGLGLNSTAFNFQNSPVFSIFLERDGSSGTFLFESNSNVTSVSQQCATWTADSNWHIDASDATLEIGDTSLGFSSKLIFDLDADAMGFPSTIYQSLMSNFQSANSKVSCSSDTYQPTCEYDGKIKHLKNIKLTIQGQKIHIPPSVYIQDVTDDEEGRIDGSFTMNIKSLDNSLSDKSYVTAEYENYIILDQTFLSYYYAEFSGENNSYTVSLSTQYKIPDDSLPVWAIIIIAIVAFVIVSLIVCCICGCVKRRRDRRRSYARKVYQSTPVVSSADAAPLVNNDQAANNNVQYPAQGNYYYPPPAYNYGHEQNVHNGYAQQYQYQNQNQNAAHAYGNMPGYTHIPQTGAYPYLPPAPGQVQENTTIYQQDNAKNAE